MNVNVKMDEAEIRQAIVEFIEKRTGVSVMPSRVIIEVKSSQNYKSEWEIAKFRCNFSADEYKEER